MRFVVIIPARYESTRLPGKPLIPLGGTPMILRTYGRCVQACAAEDVYVATDDERVKRVCEDHGARVLMTGKDCLTGTDRVAECAAMVEADYYINVQGDEPLFNPADLVTLIRAIDRFPGQIINGYCAIHDEAQYFSKGTPKVVFRPDGRLLYMSREPIPGNKKGRFVKAWRQVCAYAFTRDALNAFHARPQKTPLEEIEDIEILRFLELGFDVQMIALSSESVAVDNPEDVKIVEKEIARRGL